MRRMCSLSAGSRSTNRRVTKDIIAVSQRIERSIESRQHVPVGLLQSYLTLLNIDKQYSKVLEAWKLYGTSRMFRDATCQEKVIQSLYHLEKYAVVYGIFVKSVRLSKLSAETYSYVVSSCIRANRLDHARKVFEVYCATQNTNPMPLNILFGAIAKHDLRDAMETLNLGVKSGLILSTVSFNILLSVTDDPEQLSTIIRRMRELDIELDYHTFHVYLGKLSKVGALQQVIEFCDWAEKSGNEIHIATYNKILDWMVKHRGYDLAIQLYESLQEYGLEPNSRTENLVTTARLKGGARLTDIVSKLRQQLLLDSAHVDIVSFNIMLHQCSLNRSPSLAMELYALLLEYKLVPDIATFRSLSSVLFHSGDWLAVDRLWVEIPQSVFDSDDAGEHVLRCRTIVSNLELGNYKRAIKLTSESSILKDRPWLLKCLRIPRFSNMALEICNTIGVCYTRTEHAIVLAYSAVFMQIFTSKNAMPLESVLDGLDELGRTEKNIEILVRLCKRHGLWRMITRLYNDSSEFDSTPLIQSSYTLALACIDPVNNWDYIHRRISTWTSFNREDAEILLASLRLGGHTELLNQAHSSIPNSVFEADESYESFSA